MFSTFTFLILSYNKIAKHINTEEAFFHCSCFQILFHISISWGAFKNPMPMLNLKLIKSECGGSNADIHSF